MEDKENLSTEAQADSAPTPEPNIDFKETFDKIQSQLDNLTKQVELNRKMQQQLNNITLQSSQPEDPLAWIDKAIANTSYNFDFDNKDPNFDSNSCRQIASWYLHDLIQRQGLSREQAYARLESIFKSIKADKI